VSAFNNDKPYDRFIKEQIAGDEIYPGDTEALIATGFHRCGPIHITGGNKDDEVTRQEVVSEMTSSIGSVFLGLTVGCARCHNHKFDPILQSDYYRLQALFAGTEGKDVDTYTPEQKAAYESELKAYEARLKVVQDELEQIEKPYRAALTEKHKLALEPQYRAALELPKPQRNPEQALLAKNAEEQIKPAWDEIVGSLSAEDRTRRGPLREKLHAIQATKPAPLPAAFAVVKHGQACAANIHPQGGRRQEQDGAGGARRPTRPRSNEWDR